jgi:hypothetical protein
MNDMRRDLHLSELAVQYSHCCCYSSRLVIWQ